MGQEGADATDLTGKVVVITGANGGLGKEMATYAAAKGATLYMICRSKDKAEVARADILKAISNSKDDDSDSKRVKIVLADVGELAQVRSAVAELQKQETKVDVLVCNAGALLNKLTKTSEGNEVTFFSHLVGGSYLLSKLLLPQLEAAPNPRVLFVTSGGMLTTKFPDWATATSTQPDAEKKYGGELAYAYAKRGQVLLAERLAKTTPKITWLTAHPGTS